MIRRKLVAILSLFSIFSVANAADYSEGQVWSYKTRLGEENSTLLIDKIETNAKLGRIFHISIDGVRIKNRHIAGGISTQLPHFPVSEETLKQSLTKLIGHRAPHPDYVEGYMTWKAAFDAGKAGVFTIPVSEIIGVVEETINKK